MNTRIRIHGCTTTTIIIIIVVVVICVSVA